MSLIFMMFAIAVPTAVAAWVGGRRDGLLFSGLVFLSGAVMAIVLAAVNADLPFTESADDRDYYNASLQRVSGILDFEAFNDWFEQAGYPLLLSWINSLFGSSLYIRKGLNLSFFLGLAIVWFSIGRLIGGRHFALLLGTSLLFCTPLWFYWMFVLKDMLIILIQSLFIMALVQYMSRARPAGAIALMASASVLMIPFRVMLVLVNAAMAGVAAVLQFGRNEGGRYRAVQISAIVVAMALVFLVGSSETALRYLGVVGESRALDATNVGRAVTGYLGGGAGGMALVTFPVLYVVGEINAMNPANWGLSTSPQLRALLQLPWIFLGAPFFVVGIIQTWTRRVDRRDPGQARTSATVDPRVMLLFLAFVVIYAALSWLSADTVRWRMPVLPAMVALALWGWVSVRPIARIGLIISWVTFVTTFSIFYYWVIK